MDAVLEDRYEKLARHSKATHRIEHMPELALQFRMHVFCNRLPHGLNREADSPPPMSFRYQAQLMDMVVRSKARPMHLHETIELPTVTIEITELTDDGRPAEATFRFHVPLEDPSFRRLFVKDFRYVPFIVPSIDETVEVPSPLR